LPFATKLVRADSRWAPLELWTGFWTVPDDAPTGTVSYTVTATDPFGRTATFTPFSYSGSQLAIVE
jgi:hypothetical protein